MLKKASNPDVRMLADPSVDTTKISRIHHLLLFSPAKTAEKLKLHLAEAFGTPLNSPSEDVPLLSEDARHGDRNSAAAIGRALTYRYDSHIADLGSADVQISMILDTANDACYAVFLRQMAFLYGVPGLGDADMVLDPVFSVNMRDFWKEQWNKVTVELNNKIPFIVQGTSLENYSLATHLQEAYQVANAVDIPSSFARVTFQIDVVKNAMFYMMQPWLTFKFVASFIDPSYDVGFANRRSAELAMYRMMADTLLRTRNVLLNDTNLMQGGNMRVVSDGGDKHGHIFSHTFDTPGKHDLIVTKVPVVANVLAVGGGGGGGQRDGGGGGGGGVAFGNDIILPVGRHRVTVGSGGKGALGATVSWTGRREQATDGEASSLTLLSDENGREIVAHGGGRGASQGPGGHPAGEGGGQAGQSSKGGSGGQGGKASTDYYGWGGNGAGNVNDGSPYVEGGKGGDGLQNSITGERSYFGGGGSTGKTPSLGGGGQGGGGGCSVGSNGQDTRGGGGGASRSPDDCARGGDGGSGMVAVLFTSSPAWQDLLPTLEDFGFSVTETISKRYVHPERKNIPSYHDKVDQLSKATKKGSLDLYQTNAELQQMKSNLNVMMHNSANVRAAERRSIIVFWSVVAVYIALALIVAVLIGFKMYDAVYAIASIAIAAVLLWWVVANTRGETITNREADV